MNMWLEDVKNALKDLGSMGKYPQIYENIYKKRNGVVPKSWKQIIQRTIQSYSSDSVSETIEDIFYSVSGLGEGFWGLREIKEPSMIASDNNDDIPETVRQRTTVYRTLRDTELARNIKQLYHNRCQICGETIMITQEKKYSEAHHIKPLGSPHFGPDVAENIIVLCPNHHVLLDYGAIEIEIEKLAINEFHIISNEYINYHNNKICKKS
ncbi:HNH endonuclease [Paenibacillus sp. FSL R5-0473]|uniref:HNH endonuclease n=1 Tax=Paenibacillus sp. FSL R5-0473 TaxID=2921642 RepID=UPI0030FB41E6